VLDHQLEQGVQGLQTCGSGPADGSRAVRVERRLLGRGVQVLLHPQVAVGRRRGARLAQVVFTPAPEGAVWGCYPGRARAPARDRKTLGRSGSGQPARGLLDRLHSELDRAGRAPTDAQATDVLATGVLAADVQPVPV